MEDAFLLVCSVARQRPHRDWPDVIDYLGIGYGRRAAWFGQARNERFMCV
jgi:hypothetical protein